MAVAADGSIFISDGYGNTRVHKYSPTGDHLLSWGEPGIDPGQFMCPHNIALRGGRVYVADRESHRVQIFDLEGRLVALWNNIHRPCDLSIGPEGHIYIGELNSFGLMDGVRGIGHRVTVLDADSNLLGRFGDAEEGEEPGPFIAPTASPSTPAATSPSGRSHTPSEAAVSTHRVN